MKLKRILGVALAVSATAAAASADSSGYTKRIASFLLPPIAIVSGVIGWDKNAWNHAFCPPEAAEHQRFPGGIRTNDKACGHTAKFAACGTGRLQAIKKCGILSILIECVRRDCLWTGREKPSLETLLHICNILHVTPDYLLIGNMHTDDISQDIMESLRLCSEQDLQLARDFIELLVERNQNSWNQRHSF